MSVRQSWIGWVSANQRQGLNLPVPSRITVDLVGLMARSSHGVLCDTIFTETHQSIFKRIHKSTWRVSRNCHRLTKFTTDGLFYLKQLTACIPSVSENLGHWTSDFKVMWAHVIRFCGNIDAGDIMGIEIMQGNELETQVDMTPNLIYFLKFLTINWLVLLACKLVLRS